MTAPASLCPTSSTATALTATPSDWVVRWSHLVPTGGSVLDVACGSGRHLHWFAQRGHPVVGVDRDLAPSKTLEEQAERIEADLENAPWPLMQGAYPREFSAVVVTNYLWRPLFPSLLASLAPGGVLIYETFAMGNEVYGKPSRADFLLQPNELLQRCASLEIIAFEQGFLAKPNRVVQRMVAVRGAPNQTVPRLE